MMSSPEFDPRPAYVRFLVGKVAIDGTGFAQKSTSVFLSVLSHQCSILILQSYVTDTVVIVVK